MTQYHYIAVVNVKSFEISIESQLLSRLEALHSKCERLLIHLFSILVCIDISLTKPLTFMQSIFN